MTMGKNLHLDENNSKGRDEGCLTILVVGVLQILTHLLVLLADINVARELSIPKVLSSLSYIQFGNQKDLIEK